MQVRMTVNGACIKKQVGLDQTDVLLTFTENTHNLINQSIRRGLG